MKSITANRSLLGNNNSEKNISQSFGSRMNWLDSAKGIAMILVILGHELQPFFEELGSSAVVFIYSFHMPLFFLITGFLFSNKNLQKNFASYSKVKLKRLILPYFIYQIISILFINGFTYLTTHQFRYSLIETIQQLFYLNGTVGWNSPLWFLVVLFWLELLMYFILRCPFKIQLILVSICFLIGGFLSSTQEVYPMGLNVIFSSVIFYYGGVQLKANRQFLDSKAALITAIIGVVLLIVNMIFNPMYSTLYDNMITPNYIVFVVIALFGSFSMLYFIKMVPYLNQKIYLLI
ncbi:acyltransferase family protein [Listeria fleischmannii]|uniref:acyltransferase family protein n=1 Tax=Listeria fleischmannii TaxID=1069827 RepID=UPI0002BA5750|nr:acyltransferase family protein [Listeria fleischmannii]EMG28695.1 O-actetyl transferase related protein [Listeria fleischmannii subsp. fleischmannii LU2006-1]